MVYLGTPGPIPKPPKAVKDPKLLGEIHSVRPYCQRCSAQATSTHRLGRLQVAHILSRGRRGPDTFENVFILCHDCHMIADHDRGELTLDDKREIKAADERRRAELYRNLEEKRFGEVRWALEDWAAA